jgi:GPH family glycoside/pentoside/hexuronide:cation symporter
MQQARVPTNIVLRYGWGQLGAQIFRDTPAVLLPMFMTTMLGIPAWLSGLVILVPKLWLIVCDPLTGAYSDRMKARYGRVPFLLVGAVFTSLGFLGLFVITKYSSPGVAALALCFLFFMASTAFSIYSVPYLAISSELSSDPHERTRILMYRMYFTIIGVFVGVGVAQPMIFALGGGAHGWRVMAITFSLICLGTMLVPAIGLRKVPLLSGGSTPPKLLAQIGPVLANRPYMVLLATCFLQNIGQAASYTVIGFIFLYALNAISFVPVFIVCMTVSGLASQALWLKASRRFGKVACYIFASVTWTILTATWFFIHPGTDVIVTLPLIGPLSTQLLLVMIRSLIIGVTNSAFILLSLSMLTDTIDYQRRQHGVAHEGVFAGIFSAAEKLAFALGPVLAGIMLSLFGFKSSTGGAVQQSPTAITGIILLYSLVPVVTQVISLLIFSRYKLGDVVPVEAKPVPA